MQRPRGEQQETGRGYFSFQRRKRRLRIRSNPRPRSHSKVMQAVEPTLILNSVSLLLFCVLPCEVSNSLSALSRVEASSQNGIG